MIKAEKGEFPPQDIETILHSFEHYALGDIRFIKSKPIAAFILSICFIDQLSSFAYPKGRNRKLRPEDFIRDYMPEYKGLDLYNISRNTLVHNYSGCGKIAIVNDVYYDVPFFKAGNIIHINTDVFISYLEKAFILVSKDFRDKTSPAYENAQKRSTYHPVLVDN